MNSSRLLINAKLKRLIRYLYASFKIFDHNFLRENRGAMETLTAITDGHNMSMVEILDLLSFSACSGTADFAFIVESSYNTNSARFSQTKDFIKSLIDVINVADDGSNMAMATYNSKATLQFDLNRYHTRADLKAAVDRVAYAPDFTSNLADALRLARQTVFNGTSGGDRPRVPNFVVIITNRASTNASATSYEARLTRLAGVGIMTIAINSWLSMSELYDITSDPVIANLRILDSYDQLSNEETIGLLKTTICGQGKIHRSIINHRPRERGERGESLPSTSSKPDLYLL